MPPPPPPQSPAAPSAQYAQQFLSTALSQRGPSALPYAEDVKWLIRQHLLALAEHFPSLHPKAAVYTHNDGRSANLLQAEGTVPISFRGAVYNLPAIVWLLEPYPRRPPAVFLCPTRDMVVKPGHAFVEPSGLVCNVPYLVSWVFPSSNLLDLVRSLSHIFGVDPPLFTRQIPLQSSPATPTPRPHNPDPSSHSPPLPGSSSSSSSSSGRIYPPYGNTVGGRFPPSPQTHPPPAASRPTEDPADVYRRNATAKILETIQGDVAAHRRTCEAEMESLFSTQAELRRRERDLAKGVNWMVQEKEALEQQLQLVLTNTDVLEGWLLSENEEKRLKAGEVDVDDPFQPKDEFSRQMIECTAADLAVEDTIYSLDNAVKEGAVPFDAYLKTVRAMSREQFFHRAMLVKVHAAQVQAQIANMAARASHYAS